jgi:hypothetical protein
VDTNTGRIYLFSALVTPDHPSVVELALGISDIDDLRGFTLGVMKGRWIFANNSSLNPDENRVEADLFEAVKSTLELRLGSSP